MKSDLEPNQVFGVLTKRKSGLLIEMLDVSINQ